MILEDYGEALAYEVAFAMQGLENPRYPVAHLGDLSLEVSRKLRALAIMVLLVKADVDLFHHNLIRSGLARERYLRRLRDEGIARDHHDASGRCAPLLDAIAAGDLALARRIVALSPSEWREGHEYEDDYCYAQLLGLLIAVAPSTGDVGALLGRFETYLDGEQDPRLEVCRALANGDADQFAVAFEALLSARDATTADDRERSQLEEPEVVADREVYIEGLALLRLAEARGLATDPDYRYCPSLARVPMTEPFPGE